ncbi:baseplate assembly protein [Lonepinella koalarum]|uniref:Phage-related baseplate assembly protein n=1 Tax=Lonepinella koalarum TaxID=53417 RepID=A0A4R1KJH4_9PAST|nr:baseplate J/gp47 family protein [Lonepinella koalarum]MDH2927364.1 phage baseplate protein [Lonepinella koalarum]TCK64905.1 phage-related baseplate assembly protein [Lonepinella koalarum]TFJ88837.1 baseplate J/gp47 family protein [Lonepinella koalarum]
MTQDEIKIISDDVSQILAESIADYEQRTGKTLQPAHIERSIIQTYAYREQLVRAGINHAFLQTFPQFATGLALDLCGEPMGCYRLTDQAARCTLRFSLEDSHDNVVIPANTQVSASDSLYFSTVAEVVIRSTEQYVDIEAVANLTGLIGNGWQIGQVKTVKTPLDSNVTVQNIDETRGGIDTESDDDYRKRILLAPEAFTTCGSIAAYEYYTRAVSQTIADVAIHTPQGGTVIVTVLTKQGLPTQTLLNQIKDYLSAEKHRPLCDTVQVQAPEKIPFTVEASLDLFTTYAENEVKAKAETALKNYLSGRSQKLGVDIVPLDIQTALKVEGVYNVTLTQPPLTELTEQQWANCENIIIHINEVRKNG